MSDYQFFNLITRDSVPDIYEQFKYCGYVNGIKIWNMYSYDVRRSRAVDSRNTVIYCSNEVMSKFKSSFPGAKVESIDMDKLLTPKTEKRETWNIHVKGFPTLWGLNEIKHFLSEYLDGPLKAQYQIKAPTDRATGETYGHCTISFDTKEVDNQTIAILRWVIHNRTVKVNGDEWVLSARWHANYQSVEKKKIIKPKDGPGIRVVSIEKANPVVVPSSQ